MKNSDCCALRMDSQSKLFKSLKNAYLSSATTPKVCYLRFMGYFALLSYITSIDVQFEVDDYTHYNVKVDETLLDTITNGCRLLRNLCAYCDETKKIIDDYNLVYDVCILISMHHS